MITTTIKLYENRQDVTLTAYILSDSPELLNGKKRPAVIVCPGGAYLGCSDREAEPVALRFAAMGYHAFVLRYSTYNNGAPFKPVTGDLVVNPNSIHPAPMRDIGKAFLTIRSHADEWLVDTEKIAICGFSAGAHNCAMYSVYWQEPVICEFFGEPAEAFKPAASILGYGISDYHLLFGEMSDPFARVLRIFSVCLFGHKISNQRAVGYCQPGASCDQKRTANFPVGNGGGCTRARGKHHPHGKCFGTSGRAV